MGFSGAAGLSCAKLWWLKVPRTNPTVIRPKTVFIAVFIGNIPNSSLSASRSISGFILGIHH
jgi:hypothetical protein